ncbi:hypothetical protein RBB50_002373 [Rhinocladiella similis]
MDPIAEIIHRSMLERQRVKEALRWKLPPPLSPQAPESDDILPTENPGPSAFLDLPFDVRQLILRLLLGMEEVRTVTRRHPITDFFVQPSYDVNYSINTPVLRTCKQLSWEGQMILQKNNFIAVPNFRSRMGRIPTWKLPQSFSSQFEPIMTVRSTEPHEKKQARSLISVLDFGLFCESLLRTAQQYRLVTRPVNNEFLFELEFVPGLAQKLWGFPDEGSFLGHISTSIINSIGPFVKTIRLGNFVLSCTQVPSSHHDTHPPQELTKLEQKIWSIFKPRHPSERGGQFSTPSQRIDDAFETAERLFENQRLSQAQNEFIRVKDMIVITPINNRSQLNWCLFRLATMKTETERKGRGSTCSLKDLQEAKVLTELALTTFSSFPGNEYMTRLTFRKAELLAMLMPPHSENEIIELLCWAALDLAPGEFLLPVDRLDWVHQSVHGDDANHWSQWDPTVPHIGNYRKRDAGGLEGKVDRVRDLVKMKYGDEAKWEDFKTLLAS